MKDEDFFGLLKAIENPSSSRTAIYDLIRSGDSRTQNYLIKIALDNSFDDGIRATAIHGFEYPMPQEATLALRAMLAITPDTSSFLIPIIEGLGLQKDVDSGEKIIKYLSPEYEEGLRYITVQALGRMAFFQAVPDLQKLLKDSSKVIRYYACNALINIFDSIGQDRKVYDIVPDLKTLMNDPEESIRKHIDYILSIYRDLKL